MATLIHDHSHSLRPNRQRKIDIFAPLRQGLDRIKFRHSKFAHLVCRLIPCQCAFERDITLFGRIHHIPALCKINPLYDDLIRLRFRALTYLTDVCGEDIEKYIC
ncbi:Mo-dependent nitrogenase C-terminal domain-containing protein [Oculatella sp. LEGE 06141]|uniref:Mo-dependent nitrogenase C-terminal domain-containing protein n=1 Tax=Oculatella sp. LEGE 06141 TaxID=1828648 RepID=UPI001881185B|nr:Mo-dependent nitrogenase C-terminal domain-containing protein [Oculatella sp. LEGE 06141]MBE9183093.1 Mo-dependent nitrogenase C-terminal domain-containing protein [Oculatella sp. LEGE 06141]